MSKQNKTIHFLYEASKVLPYNALYTAIRSRMLSKCSYMNSTNSLKLDLIPRCDACGAVFQEVPPISYIKPVPKPNCHKKILNSRKNTKYQILSLKKYLKYKNDKQLLITQCKVCKKQTKTLVNKVDHARNEPVQKVTNKKKKKKKKRKKNKEFSGLTKAAVLSAKRSLENEELSSPKRLKTTNSDVIDLVSPQKNVLTPNISNYPNTSDIICLDSPQKQPKKNVLTPNISNYPNTSDIICLDSPEKQPTKKSKSNVSVIEISDSEASTASPQKKKNKKNKKPITPIVQKPATPKIKTNNNVVLVSEHNTAEKKQKKLNNLSNFLKKSENTPTQKKSGSLLQNFLNSFT